MVSNETIPMDLRRVLEAPRGRRFSHTPHQVGTRPAPRTTPQATTRTGAAPVPSLVSLGRTPRERAILAQMPDTPGLRRRLIHGDLPEWMRVAAQRRAGQTHRPQPLPWWHDQIPDRTPTPPPTPEPEPFPVPNPAHKPAEETEPAHPLPIPRPRREQAPRPQLPRRSDRPRRPASHRKPRRRIGHLITGYVLAATAGAMVQPLITLLS